MATCYLLHSARAASTAGALALYAERRTTDGKGVTLLGQRRYVSYYERFLRAPADSWLRRAAMTPPKATIARIILRGCPERWLRQSTPVITLRSQDGRRVIWTHEVLKLNRTEQDADGLLTLRWDRETGLHDDDAAAVISGGDFRIEVSQRSLTSGAYRPRSASALRATSAAAAAADGPPPMWTLCAWLHTAFGDDDEGDDAADGGTADVAGDVGVVPATQDPVTSAAGRTLVLRVGRDDLDWGGGAEDAAERRRRRYR
ncbi:hypothetical protein HK405_000267, partial [Cladochytrium tenue]